MKTGVDEERDKLLADAQPLLDFEKSKALH